MSVLTNKEVLKSINNGIMTEKLSVLKLIGLGIHQTIASEEFTVDDVDTIINGLPKLGEKIELSAEEIGTILAFVLELHYKRL